MRKKLIVTSEGCFKYFSKAYGVPSAYIWEINTEEEGTPDQIKTLVEKLRQTKVPSLFVESSVDDRPMKTVSQDTNIPIYAQIFTDSIAEQGKEGDSYYNMMKYNLDKMLKGWQNNTLKNVILFRIDVFSMLIFSVKSLENSDRFS